MVLGFYRYLTSQWWSNCLRCWTGADACLRYGQSIEVGSELGFSEDIRAARILIVDDMESNVVLLECMLEASGYTNVESVMDSRLVADLHRKHRYDLILLDLSMPHMSGFEVMEVLKPLETDGYLPSGITAEPTHKLRALKAGAKTLSASPSTRPR